MTIISLAAVNRKRQLTLFLFLLTLLFIPFQKPMKGFFAHLVKRLTPTDLVLPHYFSKQFLIFPSDLCIFLFLGAILFFLRPSLSRFFWEGPSKYLTCLFFTALLSLVLSKTALYPLQYVKLFYFFLYFCLFSAIRLSTPFLDLGTLLKGSAYLFMSVSLFEGTIALCQYFQQSALGLSALGEISLSHFPFSYNGASLYWGAPPLSGVLFRASGTFFHPNILGSVLFCGILSSFYLFQKQTMPLLRLLLGIGLFLQFSALYLSFSRSALLAAFLAIPLFYLFLFFSGAITKSSLIKKGVILAAAALALTIAFLPALSARGGIVNYKGLAKGADSERLYYCKIALDMVSKHPLFGVGYNNFQLYSQAEYPEMPRHYFHSKVHNIFLLTAAEMGLIGFAFLFLFLFHTLLPLCRQIKLKRLGEERAWLLSVMTGLLCIGCFDFFLLCSGVGLLLFFSVTGFLSALREKV